MSICAQKVRLTLEEKSLGWESRHLDLKEGDQQKPDYLKLNPRGLVPTLLDRDRAAETLRVVQAHSRKAELRLGDRSLFVGRYLSGHLRTVLVGNFDYIIYY